MKGKELNDQDTVQKMVCGPYVTWQKGALLSSSKPHINTVSRRDTCVIFSVHKNQDKTYRATEMKLTGNSCVKILAVG